MEALCVDLLENAISSTPVSNDNSNLIIRKILKRRKLQRCAILNYKIVKRKIPKTKNFCKTISLMPDDVFYSHFRMRNSTFNKLLYMIKPFWSLRSAGRVPISLRKALYITIWKLANNCSFRDVSDRFGVSIGAAYQLFVKIIKLIIKLKRSVIQFPETLEEKKKISDGFAASRCYPFPFVLGCIDGTHISISQPLKDAISFYNRKGTYSIVAQAVVDSQMRFLDVFIGCPGRCHDASIWQMSPLRKAIVGQEISIPSNYHLLGDGAYPLEMFMMVPYRDNGFLTAKQAKFNSILSSTRVFVEQAFGILKKKFKILKHIEVQRQNLPKQITMACMILHNIIIANEGTESIINIAVDEDGVDNENSFSEPAHYSRNDAKAKRDALATLFSA